MLNWFMTLADVIDPGYPPVPSGGGSTVVVTLIICLAIITAVILFVKKL